MGYLETIYADDPLGAILAVYTDKMGGWVYVILGMALMAGLYIKTEDSTMPLIVGLLLGVSAVALFPPEIAKVAWILITIAILGGFWKMVMGRGG